MKREDPPANGTGRAAGKRGRPQKWTREARRMKREPGTNFKIASYPRRTQEQRARSLATHINTGKLAAFPAGEYHAVSRIDGTRVGVWGHRAAPGCSFGDVPCAAPAVVAVAA